MRYEEGPIEINHAPDVLPLILLECHIGFERWKNLL